ncbi:type II toxin-antitoxin system VapC family toxin [Sphingomonas sp. UYEF23]|uniref:type II toxin-antitoxin system VapC family toxin n=1 Tax=Sphingomonas sp. UYEF23 TaxID=1756408 RepID=UPI003397E2CB
MITAVLDASAIIALLKGERGASKVASVVAEAVVGVFNQAEVVSHYIHLGAPIDEIRAMLSALPYTIVAADEALAWEAGGLRALTSSVGLSLGDRFCLALAKQIGMPAFTADRAWRDVAADVGVKVVLIR